MAWSIPVLINTYKFIVLYKKNGLLHHSDRLLNVFKTKMGSKRAMQNSLLYLILNSF